MRRLLPIAALVMALAAPAAAQAAQRYAAPEGSGAEPCAQAAPCSLTVAIKKAKANDEVIVARGSYTIKEFLYPEGNPANVYIHGDLGGPMPRIVGSGSSAVMLVVGAGSRLAYLEMTNAGNGAIAAFCTAGTRIERVRASVEGEGAIAMNQAADCVVQDSIAVASGTSSKALNGAGSLAGSNTAVARNVTAIATGANSKGAFVWCLACFPTGSITLDLRNAIVSGGGNDLEASGASTTAKIVVSNSNFDSSKGEPGSIVDPGANQTAPPLFISPGAGDYREAPGSPTIDAGTNNQLGATDFEGNPRTVGLAPDIGAFEFMPPLPPPVPLGEIQTLTISPKSFRAVNAGGAILSARKKARTPIGTTVTYSLSAGAAVTFAVERKAAGRRVGKRCQKKTKVNATKKKCPLFKPVKGGFSHSGAAGTNRFKFSGRLVKALPPGSYRLIGRTSTSSRAAGFRVVR